MQYRELDKAHVYHKAFGFDIKETTDAGHIRGHGSVFGVIDSYNEIVAQGAFAESLKKWAKRGALPAMLRGHESNIVVGVWTQMQEDAIGLDCAGDCILETRDGADTYQLLKRKAVRGLSIGFMPEVWEVDKETGIITLKQVDLWEVSIVTFPANVEAMIEEVKHSVGQVLKSGNIPTERDFEIFLRDAGYSRGQAKRIIACGYRSLRDAGNENEEIEQALLELSQRITFNAGSTNDNGNKISDRKDRNSV
jgi:HK97 family phage prohead protease